MGRSARKSLLEAIAVETRTPAPRWPLGVSANFITTALTSHKSFFFRTGHSIKLKCLQQTLRLAICSSHSSLPVFFIKHCDKSRRQSGVDHFLRSRLHILVYQRIILKYFYLPCCWRCNEARDEEVGEDAHERGRGRDANGDVDGEPGMRRDESHHRKCAR